MHYTPYGLMRTISCKDFYRPILIMNSPSKGTVCAPICFAKSGWKLDVCLWLFSICRASKSAHIHVHMFSCVRLCDPMDRGLPGFFLYPWNCPGKNSLAGCCFLLQGILPTQGLNPRLMHLLHWQVDFLPLGHLGSPQSAYEFLKPNLINKLVVLLNSKCSYNFIVS